MDSVPKAFQSKLQKYTSGKRTCAQKSELLTSKRNRVEIGEYLDDCILIITDNYYSQSFLINSLIAFKIPNVLISFCLIDC